MRNLVILGFLVGCSSAPTPKEVCDHIATITGDPTFNQAAHHAYCERAIVRATPDQMRCSLKATSMDELDACDN